MITGAKDSRIKVWNSQNCLIWTFSDSVGAISGLEIIERGCEAAPKTIPVILTSYLHGGLRMFNLETGKCVYRLDTQHEVRGLAFIRKEVFYYFSETDVHVLGLNRYQSMFQSLRSQSILLKRTSDCRILCNTTDGSVKLLSPVTGSCLSTGFPIHRDVSNVDIIYDHLSSKAYSLDNLGGISIYDCKTNPFKICFTHEYSSSESEKINCITEVYVQTNGKETFYLVAGTNQGQFVSINLENGTQELIVQAHIARVTRIYFELKSRCFISVSEDLTIKFWRVGLMSEMNVKRRQTDEITYSDLVFKVDVILNLSLFGLPAPSCLAVNPFQKIIAFKKNNMVVFTPYSESKTVQLISKEKEPNGEITNIIYLASLDIWGASSTDGTIKIFDGEGTVIREIQFNEPLYAFCYANNPGDLLVGISESISIVRIQDCMFA